MDVELESGIVRLAQLAEERDMEFEQDDGGMIVDDDDFDVEMSTKKDTSRKAYNKEFKKVIEQADVVLYILDARDPEGTRSKEIESMIRESPNGEKQLLLILNKIGNPLLTSVLTFCRFNPSRNFKSLAYPSSSIIPCAPLSFQHKSPIHSSYPPSKETFPPPS